MKQFKIEVPDGYEIDQENSNLAEGVVKFKPIAKKIRVPKSIDDVKDRDWYINGYGRIYAVPNRNDKNNFSTKERAEAMLALGQLIEIHSILKNEFDNLVNYTQLVSKNKDITIDFWFESDEQMDEFFTLHKQLIETVCKGL